MNSPFQRVHERFWGEKPVSEFIKFKQEFEKLVEIDLGWYNVTEKFDSI